MPDAHASLTSRGPSTPGSSRPRTARPHGPADRRTCRRLYRCTSVPLSARGLSHLPARLLRRSSLRGPSAPAGCLRARAPPVRAQLMQNPDLGVDVENWTRRRAACHPGPVDDAVLRCRPPVSGAQLGHRHPGERLVYLASPRDPPGRHSHRASAARLSPIAHTPSATRSLRAAQSRCLLTA